MPTTYFDWDELADNTDAEYDEAGNVVAEYTHEPGLHGSLISELRGGQTYYHHYDGQGNTIALSVDSGNVTDTFAYTAFGEVTERTGTTDAPFQYGGEHGYYFDEETGDYLVRRRALSAAIGRWLSPDPTGQLDDVNRYRYVQNDPVALIDPSGLAFDCLKDRKHIRCAELRIAPYVPPPPEERIGRPLPRPMVDVPCGKGMEYVVDLIPGLDEFGRIIVNEVPVCLSCIPVFTRGEICRSERCAICALSRLKIIREGRRPFVTYEVRHQCTCVESPFEPCDGASDSVQE
jgi:RHS repeat-associated protein